MTLSSVRYTILQIINQTRGLLGITAGDITTSTLPTNKQALAYLQYINQIVSDLRGLGKWQSLLTETNFTAVSGQKNYSFNSADEIHSVKEIAFEGQISKMRYVSVEQIRMRERSYGTTTGTPYFWSLVGEDANANPIIRIQPTPGASEAGKTLNVLYYKKPPLYTTADGNEIPPFSGVLMVQGLLYKGLLDEYGSDTDVRVQAAKAEYDALKLSEVRQYTAENAQDVYMQPAIYNNGY